MRLARRWLGFVRLYDLPTRRWSLSILSWTTRTSLHWRCGGCCVCITLIGLHDSPSSWRVCFSSILPRTTRTTFDRWLDRGRDFVLGWRCFNSERTSATRGRFDDNTGRVSASLTLQVELLSLPGIKLLLVLVHVLLNFNPPFSATHYWSFQSCVDQRLL